MSTRGVIARRTEDGGWRGRYCHFDNYPSGRGKALWAIYHGPAKGDLEDMARFFVDEHPGGWSTIENVDAKPGDVLYDPERFWSQGRYPGACYCHRADTGEPGPEYEGIPETDKDAAETWGEYAYVLEPPHAMTIYAHRNGQWHFLTTVDFEGEEPDWKRL